MIGILYQIEHLNFGLRGCEMSVKVIFCKWGNDKEIANEIGPTCVKARLPTKTALAA